MHGKHPTHGPAPTLAEPTDAFATGLGTWRMLTIDLPLRVAAETMRFTGRRFQAQADHYAALAKCGTLQGALALNAEFLTKGVSDYQKEATSLSQDVTESTFAKVA